MLEQVAAQLVRKAAIGSSTVHLALGGSRFDGSELLVQAGASGLEVRLTAPVGVDADGLGKAITERLERRGLRVASVIVD